MDAITHKADLDLICDHLAKNKLSTAAQVAYIHKYVLTKKVKFPLLEYFTEILFPLVPKLKQSAFTNGIIALDEIGSYTIAGKFLQLQLFSKIESKKFSISKNYKHIFETAGTYIIKANKWYACDIIGERVFGFALLNEPEKTIPYLKKLAKHEDKWMQRAIGVATHYAVKKGLAENYAAEMFRLLLSLGTVTDFHTKKGIGWAAKTTAKFHPDIIKKHHAEIYNHPNTRQWFKTKIKIGLGRNAYLKKKVSS